jgi:putative transposase
MWRPGWRCTSKEAYASGIADLVAGLHNWSDAKAGRRKGARVGFPRFKARHRDRGWVRFTTGAMHLEPDRRHLTVPVIGKLRSKENTRRLERLVVNGRARILSMTLSERGGRLVVAVQAIVAQQPRHPAEPEGRCGVDLGVGPEWAIIAHHDGTIERVAHPAPGRRSTSSSAAWPGRSPAAPSDPERPVTRKPSVRRWTGGRRTSAARPSTF